MYHVSGGGLASLGSRGDRAAFQASVSRILDNSKLIKWINTWSSSKCVQRRVSLDDKII